VRGLGLFARANLEEEDTNIVRGRGSITLGGRGLIPTRDDDTFGVGFAYTKFNSDRQLVQLLADEEAYRRVRPTVRGHAGDQAARRAGRQGGRVRSNSKSADRGVNVHHVFDGLRPGRAPSPEWY
jgi:hypothetical protein